MSTLGTIVAKFRKSSPNIAAAFDEVELRLIALENQEEPPPPPPPPPPPSGYGAKLPAWFQSVYKLAPTDVQTISGANGDVTLSSSTPKRFVFAAGATARSVRLEGLRGCVVDFGWAKIRDGLDGIKAVGCSDLLVRRFDIAGVRNQGILATNCSRYAFTHGKIGPNTPDQSLPGWRDHAHGIYLATSPDGLLGNIVGTGQRTGYSVQVYPDSPRIIATGVDLNNPNDLGSSYSGSAFVWGSGSAEGLIVNSIARDCRFQMVYGGAGAPVPAVRVVTSAEIGRRGWYPDGQPGAVVGSPDSSPDSAGDHGYRLPDDPRTTGLGTYNVN